MDLQTGVIKAVSTSIRIPVCTEQERTARVKCLGPLFRHTNRLKDIRDSVTVCEAHVIYRVKEKKTQARPTEGEYTHEYKKGIRRSGMDFLSSSLLTVKENAQNVRLEFPCRHCTRQTSGTLLSSTMSKWGCSPRLTKKRPSRYAARCGSAD